MRYTIVDETFKEGRKKIPQFAVWDLLEDRAIARFAKLSDAEELLIRYQTVVDRQALDG